MYLHNTVDGQYIPNLFIEPEVCHDKSSYWLKRVLKAVALPVLHQINKKNREELLNAQDESQIMKKI